MEARHRFGASNAIRRSDNGDTQTTAERPAQRRRKLHCTRSLSVVLVFTPLALMAAFSQRKRGVGLHNKATAKATLRNNKRPRKKHWSSLDCSSFAADHNDGTFLADIELKNTQSYRLASHDPQEDCPISADIHRYGCYECHVLYPLIRALEDESSKANPTQQPAMIDIGANIGLYGLTAAYSLGIPAYLIEPAKVNQDRICETVRANENSRDNLVTVFKAAAVDPETRKGGETLQLTGTNDLNKGGIVVGGVQSAQPNDRRDKVEGIDFARTLTLAELDKAGQLPISGSTIVLKVDVEGNECSALEGAMEYLRSVKIVYCAIELSQERLRQCKDQVRQELFALLESNGLKPYQAMLNSTTHPTGWKELNSEEWENWIWHAPNRKRPDKALFDVAWSKTKPKLEGPIVAKIDPKRC